MTPVAARVLQAVTDRLEASDLEGCAGGTVSIVVKLDDAGCPRRIGIKTEVEHAIERRRPRAMAG